MDRRMTGRVLLVGRQALRVEKQVLGVGKLVPGMDKRALRDYDWSRKYYESTYEFSKH